MKIIDGYNVIGAAKEFGFDLSQPGKEERLLRFLASYRSRRRSHEPMLVVFDGHYGKLADGPRKYSQVGIDVEWAVGETADAVILRRVRQSRHPKEIEVVTSDALVRRNIASWGAKGLSSPEFLAQIHRTLTEAPEAEKPEIAGPKEVAEWLERFEKGR